MMHWPWDDCTALGEAILALLAYVQKFVAFGLFGVCFFCSLLFLRSFSHMFVFVFVSFTSVAFFSLPVIFLSIYHMLFTVSF